MASADLQRCAHALVAVCGRQANVDDGDLGRVAPHLQEQLVRGAGARDDLEALVAEEFRLQFAQFAVVVNNQHALHPGLPSPRRF